jgi:hypothetical protein
MATKAPEGETSRHPRSAQIRGLRGGVRFGQRRRGSPDLPKAWAQWPTGPPGPEGRAARGPDLGCALPVADRTPWPGRPCRLRSRPRVRTPINRPDPRVRKAVAPEVPASGAHSRKLTGPPGPGGCAARGPDLECALTHADRTPGSEWPCPRADRGPDLGCAPPCRPESRPPVRSTKRQRVHERILRRPTEPPDLATSPR